MRRRPHSQDGAGRLCRDFQKAVLKENTSVDLPAPALVQEEAETQKHEENKMSKIDLDSLSLEELQAALEKKKAEEEGKPIFELDENDPSNLAIFLFDNLAVRLGVWNTQILDGEIAKYPGNLTKFCYLYDKDDKRTNNKNEVASIRVVSTYGDYVIDASIDQFSPAFSTILSKIGETHFNTNYTYRPGHGYRWYI